MLFAFAHCAIKRFSQKSFVRAIQSFRATLCKTQNKRNATDKNYGFSFTFQRHRFKCRLAWALVDVLWHVISNIFFSICFAIQISKNILRNSASTNCTRKTRGEKICVATIFFFLCFFSAHRRYFVRISAAVSNTPTYISNYLSRIVKEINIAFPFRAKETGNAQKYAVRKNLIFFPTDSIVLKLTQLYALHIFKLIYGW